MTAFADITLAHPLRLVLQLPDGSLVDLTSPMDAGRACVSTSVVRIEAPDLRVCSRKTAALHAEAAERGDETSVLVDLEVVIDRDMCAARKTLADLKRPVAPNTLRYVGTATGLAGLIADIHTLQLTDGVTLMPLSQLALDLILDEALPQLRTMGLDAVGNPLATVRQSQPSARTTGSQEPA
ncbi:hypothetical protein [Mycolicibacter senuensis]|uniref:hypothetical protein n=1 Tax=Mycolicibacter senuensis TaxID=386913 RepID=UPI001057F241|nr:hypothetical protein [Mycolicibacter senuensis]